MYNNNPYTENKKERKSVYRAVYGFVFTHVLETTMLTVTIPLSQIKLKKWAVQIVLTAHKSLTEAL